MNLKHVNSERVNFWYVSTWMINNINVVNIILKLLKNYEIDHQHFVEMPLK